jgi:hypothetical protein
MRALAPASADAPFVPPGPSCGTEFFSRQVGQTTSRVDASTVSNRPQRQKNLVWVDKRGFSLPA